MLRLAARARTLGLASAVAIAGLGVAATIPAAAQEATTWHVQVGGGDPNTLSSLNRFYPNDITVHPGDTVAFAWAGFHTVTFNPQPNLSLLDYAFFGTPSASNSLDTPTTFVNGAPSPGGSGPPPAFDLAIGSTLPAGTYHYSCRLHQFMHGVIRVTNGELPSTDAQNQALAAAQQAKDAKDAARLDSRTTREAAHQQGEATVGVSDRVAEFVKFYPTNITINAGDELTFTTRDLHEPHTVTFGEEPDPNNPFGQVFPSGTGNPNAYDGTSPLNSGFLFHQSQYDYWNLTHSILSAAVPRTHFSVTFTTPGTYDFYCALHGARIPDPANPGQFIVVGMSGHITVLPAQGDEGGGNH
ncbi:MAG TPA: plastocyanin/azurin family copper-binding protein [Candidatus Limnocylindrales bacterium]|nr:plastocyanin/azurin family copper-binding protein [Candidatus Limnocylindrales bacterium]